MNYSVLTNKTGRGKAFRSKWRCTVKSDLEQSEMSIESLLNRSELRQVIKLGIFQLSLATWKSTGTTRSKWTDNRKR